MKSSSVAALAALWALFAFAPVSLTQPATNAATWPGFRGALLTGTSSEQFLPGDSGRLTTVWSAPVPGSGHSSPVVHGDTVFVSTSYLNRAGQIRYVIYTTISGIAVLFTGTAACIRIFAHRPSSWLLLALGVRLWIMLLLTTVGYALLGCNSDTLRSGLYCVLLLAVALDTSRVMTNTSRRAQMWVVVCAVAAVVLGLRYFYTLPFLRQPRIVTSIILLPLFSALLSLKTLFVQSRRARFWWWTIAALFMAFPLLAVGSETLHWIGDAFWKIQPTRRMDWPPQCVFFVFAVLTAGVLFRLAGSKYKRCKVTGLLLLALSVVAIVPMFAAPIVNLFDYSRYQLVRGSLDSPLGLPVVGLMVCVLSFLPLIMPGVFYRTVATVEHSRALQLALFGFPLFAGVTGCMAAFTAGSAGSVCALAAFDAQTGRLLWKSEALVGKPMPKGSSFNSPATPTPHVVGDVVAAYFGERGAFGCRMADGTLLWSYLDLPYRSDYGVGSSLEGTESEVVVQSDSDREFSFIAALSLINGRPAWKHTRDDGPAWRTPAYFSWRGRLVVCAWGAKNCDFLDAMSGELFRRIVGIDVGAGDPVVSPVVKPPYVYLLGTERLAVVSLDKLFGLPAQESQLRIEGARRQSKHTNVVMMTPEFCVELDGEGATCSTPALGERSLFLVSDPGTLAKIDLHQRCVSWKTDVGPTKGSPVIANQHLFVVNEKGKVHVFSLAGPEPRLVTTFDLGESVVSTPAIAHGSLFIRTGTKLSCLRGSSP